jgi:DNA ligase 1
MRPMLAKPCEIKQVKFPVYISPKLDGIRALCCDGEVRTRSWELVPNRFIRERLASKGLHGLDGELISGEPTAKGVMQATSSCVMSQESTAYWTYHVFDVWHTPEKPFRGRLAAQVLAIGMFADLGYPITLVPQFLVDSADELTYWEEQYLEQGYEGLIIRSPIGLYKQGRSTINEGYLLKLKRFVDSEMVVTGYEAKLHNANPMTRDKRGYAKRSSHKANMVPLDTLGTLLGTDIKSGKPVRLGSGFTDEMRKHIWDNQKKYIGAPVTYKHFPKGVKNLVRFGVFKAFRDKRDM